MTEVTLAHQAQDMQELINQIISCREEIAQVSALRKDLINQAEELQLKCKSLEDEMTKSLKLLNHCLITGEDMTTVKLTKNTSQLELDSTEQILMEEIGRIKKRFAHTPFWKSEQW